MVTVKDALEILIYAEAHGIPLQIGGGWSVDALLGEQTRPHNDIDLFLEKRYMPRYEELLKSRGFERVTVQAAPSFLVTFQDAKGRLIDLYLFEYGPESVYCIGDTTFPSTAFSARGEIGGKAVRCVPAQDMVDYLTQVGVNRKTWHDVRTLCDRFDLALPFDFRPD